MLFFSKMRVFVVLFSLFFSSTSFGAYSEQNKFRLLVYGDSLCAGYRLDEGDGFIPQLQARLHMHGFKNVELVHASKSGETAEGGFNKLKSLNVQSIDGVLLELGINDAIKGYSVRSIRNNLYGIIQFFKEKNIPVFLVGMKAPPIAKPLYQKEFAQVYADLAREFNLVYYPFFMKGVIDIDSSSLHKLALQSAMGKLPVVSSSMLQSDYVHPTKEGVAVMVHNIFPYVEKFLLRQGVKPL